uniref:U4/U6.U5 tri-snRNP-associated protein 1 n=1 Tax=Plectus sambesii TaxID=2011161 RepID=A0A914X4B4_9BILA
MSHREGGKSRHQRKRKGDLDQDTSEEGAKGRERRRERDEKEKEQARRSHSPSSSPDPPPKKERKHDRGGDKKSEESSGGGGGDDSVLSIEETNKLRAKLGLAPLEVDDKPKIRDSESGDPKEKIVNEDGFEFTHKVADNWAEKKRHAEVKEKIETSKEKRKIYDKLSKVKGLADDDDVSALSWVEKSRKIEEERRLAEQRAKTLQEMDEEFGIDNLIEETKKKVAQKKAKAARQNKQSDLAGLMVQHSKEAFLEGKEVVLVLKDKGVLDEGEEVLVNPNIIDDERARKNIELRKKKAHYNAYDDEEVDDFGMVKKKNMLDKYDEELDGAKMDTFRLDESGSMDIDKETQMIEIKRRLHAATKNEQSLEQPKFTLASEYYTSEEMTAFKKPKKKTKKDKLRKRTALKADDLIPMAIEATEEGDFGSRSRGKGRKKEVYEEGETVDDEAPADTKQMKPKPKLEIDDDEEDDFGGVDDDLSGVAIDDEVEDELASVLDKARKLKQKLNTGGDPAADNAAEWAAKSLSSMPTVKEEPMEEDTVSGTESGAVVLDATSEYCRNLGDIPTYGLAGNRLDGIDVEELMDETKEPPVVKADEEVSDDDDMSEKKAKKGTRHKEVAEDEYEQAIRHAQENSKGKWVEASTSSGRPSFAKNAPASSSKSKKPDESDKESDEEEGGNVLGEEADVTKGVAAMLKLAAQKGYLDDSKKKLPSGPSLKHLHSKRYVQVEAGKHDNDDAKYTKKLERLGAAGSGPVRPFAELRDYKPSVRISYTDGLGHEMDAKDAFRQLSWKFHGKGPGKKQIEKRTRGMVKKELMKQMNSMDTPLGTLEKQQKKQERLQTPYLVLSGSSKDSTGAPLKKD